MMRICPFSGKPERMRLSRLRGLFVYDKNFTGGNIPNICRVDHVECARFRRNDIAAVLHAEGKRAEAENISCDNERRIGEDQKGKSSVNFFKRVADLIDLFFSLYFVRSR